MFDDETKLLCLERELRLRRKVYPRWVAEGRMKMRDAEHETEVMEAIANDYRQKIPDLFRPGKGPARDTPG